jgi:hypothetical protein
MAKVRSLKSFFLRGCFGLLLFFAPGFAPLARAALQFDVFLGYDGVVPEANWFPVVCEVRNDGPSFNAFFEISSGQFSQGQVRRVPIELPTNTRKRVVVPVFSSSRDGSWNFRLIDDRGNVHAEELNKRPRQTLAWEIPMIGALSRTVGGVPTLPNVKPSTPELQPVAARLQPALFPDNPIALEGLDTLYLDSETALELKVAQRDALLAWLNGGGHLVLGVEQVSDIAASGWLAELLPCELSATKMIKPDAEFQNWLQRGEISLLDVPEKNPSNKKKSSAKVLGANPFSELNADEKFQQSELMVFTGKLRDGTALVEAQGMPLVVEAPRGRGKITLLNFSAEREPFLSWKNRPWFWVKLAGISPMLYQTSDYNRYGGSSIDSVFGAMIDSKQVRKLPLTWLLLLLVVYLLVIGPLDQYWLKKINRQMLTWITFPLYVLFFSVLIYFIGFQLRAGDSEFNELQIVDVFPRTDKAVLRGRSYASIYSPSNKRYPLASEQPFATLRGEFSHTYNGGEENSQATVIQRGNNFLAEVSVPVWTSQLYVGDWLQPADLPVKIVSARDGDDWAIEVENLLDRQLSQAEVVLGNRIYLVGDLPAHGTKKSKLKFSDGVPLKNFVQQNGGNFFQAAQFRRQTFGNNRMDFNVPLGAMAASFCSQLDESQGNQYFISPDGFDLSKLAEQGNTILLAWDSDHLLAKPLNQFTPRRNHRDTLLRLVVPKN